jgi:hypothetical protein
METNLAYAGRRQNREEVAVVEIIGVEDVPVGGCKDLLLWDVLLSREIGRSFPRLTAGSRVAPASWPPEASLHRPSDFALRSHRAWKPRFYWAPEYLREPFDSRACGM